MCNYAMRINVDVRQRRKQTPVLWGKMLMLVKLKVIKVISLPQRAVNEPHSKTIHLACQWAPRRGRSAALIPFARRTFSVTNTKFWEGLLSSSPTPRQVNSAVWGLTAALFVFLFFHLPTKPGRKGLLNGASSVFVGWRKQRLNLLFSGDLRRRQNKVLKLGLVKFMWDNRGAKDL